MIQKLESKNETNKEYLKVEDQKTVIVTGCGQDSSYLADLLLEKGYKVVMLIRRSSYPNTRRVEHLKEGENFIMEYFDLIDEGSIRNLISKYKPSIIFNMAAMSHVGISFKIPKATIEFNTIGLLNILEAVRQIKPDCKVYQASSSEMFGISPPPQNELTPMLPCSPYGVSKLASFHLMRCYREGYGMFCTNGILFNHETMADFMPIFVKEGNEFDIKPFRDVLTFIDRDKKEYQGREITGLEILGKDGWTKVKYASAYPHNIINNNKQPRLISARCGMYLATGSHIAFMQDKEKKTSDIKVGDKFETVNFKINFPIITDQINKENKLLEAELIGMLVADGYINKKDFDGKFTKNDLSLRQRFKYLWKKIVDKPLREQKTQSGFKKGNFVTQTIFNKCDFTQNLDLYTTDRKKRIPKRILNADNDIQMAFLKGYNSCDGLKKDNCVYEFKSFKTNSATLAQGLWYLTDKLLPKQRKTFYTFNSKIGSIIYCINFNSSKQINSPLSKEFSEVTKVIDLPNYEGWFYDIETESNEFVAGVGNIHVHNSERRGLNFVTRKITRGIANIISGKQDKIELGNIDSKRDWGHSKDYMNAIVELMELEKPMDLVISTGETHTVREFLQEAFSLVGLNWEEFVVLSDKQLRPFDVPALLGDNSKALSILKWRPKIKFKELVKEMLEYDLLETTGMTIEQARGGC